MRIQSVELCGLYPFRTPFRIEDFAQYTMITGRNGSGKSTLLRVISACLDEKSLSNLLSPSLLCSDHAYVSIDFLLNGIVYTIKKTMKVTRNKIVFAEVNIFPEEHADFILAYENEICVFCSSERTFNDSSDEVVRAESRLSQSIQTYLDGLTNGIECAIQNLDQELYECGPFRFSTSIDWKKAVKLEMTFTGERENHEEDFDALSSGERRMTMMRIALEESKGNRFSILLIDDVECFLDAIMLLRFFDLAAQFDGQVILSTHSIGAIKRSSGLFDIRIVDPSFDCMHNINMCTEQYLSNYLI